MLLNSFEAGKLEAGCDEAGRGCLAGPVFAAAVILPDHFSHPLLDDSKKMTAAQRMQVREVIEREALTWAVGVVGPEEIDAINILQASFLAMHRALEQLEPQPESLLIDGNRFHPYRNLPFHCMVRGDGRFLSIAAASVLAKTHRDEYMLSIAADFPVFAWDRNKGYPTEAHREAIARHGPCVHHRRSFRLLPEARQGKLF